MMLYPRKPKGKPSEFPVYQIDRDWVNRLMDTPSPYDGRRGWLKDQIVYKVIRNGEITEQFYTKREAEAYVRELRARDAERRAQEAK